MSIRTFLGNTHSHNEKFNHIIRDGHYLSEIDGKLNKEKFDKECKTSHLHTLTFHRQCVKVRRFTKDLWQIEESFRISKTNLKIRPIYHYKPSRIRAHVGICFLSLCLVRHIQVRLKRAHINFSFQKIQEELKRVQYSICKDYSTGIRFKVPSSLNPIASEIYAALGLKRKDSMTVYQN